MNAPREAYLSATASFVRQVGRIPLDLLPGPGLGPWDLRALVGHTARSLVTVETYLDQPVEVVEAATAADYYRLIAPMLSAGGGEIVERGRQAGEALGEDPASYVRDLASRVTDKLASYDDGYRLTTIAGGMRLGEYLRTRTFELVVHGLDIAGACGVDPGLDEDALADAATLAVEVAVRSGRGAELVLAVTGRASLPAGFSIV